jgi:hypothetical protein
MKHLTPTTAAIHDLKGTPAKNTNGLLRIYRQPDQLRRILTGKAHWTHFVKHEPTGCDIAGFKTKAEAVSFAAELFAKLTPEQWHSRNADVVGDLLLPFKPWIKAENDRRWS